MSRSSDRIARSLPALALPDVVVSPAAVVCAMYLLALAGAELLLITSGLIAGAVAHVLLVAVLIAHVIAAPAAPYRRLLVVLLLPSLVRLLGLTVPVAGTPQVVWYLMVGVPSLLGAGLAARVIGLPARLLAPPASPWVQLVIMLSGVSSGLLAYAVLRPAPVTEDPLLAVATGTALAVFVAGTEELVFRGNLQTVIRDLFNSGNVAVSVSAGVFTLMYAGQLSLPFTLVMLSMGVLLGWAVERTDSLWGALGAHAAMIVGLVVVWPVVLR